MKNELVTQLKAIVLAAAIWLPVLTCAVATYGVLATPLARCWVVAGWMYCG